jgi:hypothetical protein
VSKVIEKIANGTKYNENAENDSYKAFLNLFLERYDKNSLEFINSIIDVDDPDVNYSSNSTVK